MPKKGYKQTKEHKEKNREANRKANSGKNNPMYGKKHSKITKQKISKALMGIPLSEERKKKISNAIKGRISPMKGRKHSEETKQKMKESRKKQVGENSPFWQGGVSFEPYSFEFNNRLKKLIRQRDNYQCQFCGNEENGKAFCPHHIDYDKQNSDKKNLILLCIPCNVKANSNREKWQFLFRTLQEIRLI
jgi:hypothetical protein